MATTKMVPAVNGNAHFTNGTRPSLPAPGNDIEAWFVALLERCDVEALDNVEREAGLLVSLATKVEAAAFYVQHYERVRLLALAGIGQLDLRRNPAHRWKGELIIGGEEKPRLYRQTCRVLAVAQERGCLEKAITSGRAQWPTAVANRAMGLGALRTPRSQLQDLAKRSGLPGPEIARRAGVPRSTVNYMLRNKTYGPRALYLAAKPLVEAMGYEAASLRLAPMPKRSAGKLEIRPVKDPAWSKAFQNTRRALENVDALLGTRDDPLWEHLYAALDDISRRT